MISLASSLLAVLPALSVQDAGPPEVGEPFPALAFPQLGEEALTTLADFRGTRVLLIQFASW